MDGYLYVKLFDFVIEIDELFLGEVFLVLDKFVELVW